MGDGTESGNGRAWRRLRVDESAAGAGPDVLGPRRSGRRFVIAAGLATLAVAAILAVAFGAWRSRQRALAEFGASRVATTVLPLAERVPPGLGPEEWGRVVEQARRLVVALTGAGALDRRQMEDLRAELRDRVASARPETAAGVLDRIWTDLEDRAGPVLTRAPRFQLPATVSALAHLEPPGVAPADWSLATLRTRAALAAASDPSRMPSAERRALRDELMGITAGVEAEGAVEALGAVWDRVGPLVPEGFGRPQGLGDGGGR